MKLDHIAVVSSDIKRDVEWYTSTFNCGLSYQDDTWALLKFDNVSLALVTKGEHPNHFAVVDPLIKGSKNVKKHRDDIHYVYKKDPSGNIVEIIDRPSS